MNKVSIGNGLNLDVNVLLRTRMLVQANSGGGKSWLLRRLAEQLFGKIQVILVDPEGEFATLRERHGYVLVGQGGETPADPRSAALVAQRLLELRASAICDIYELKAHERHHWVRLFIEALIDAPKKLWHPAVIIVDEAHQYAPEKGAGESEASSAMIDLTTKGRKRGFAAVFATQRLGKLRKDAAAELLNILIGQTFIDIDRKRAADALGIPPNEQRKFYDEMKVLEPGNFFALGRALSKERVLVKVGMVETTHPDPGSAKHYTKLPPAPSEVKALLPKLADLPKAAEEQAKTTIEFKREIRSLKGQLRVRPAETKEVLVADTKAMERLRREFMEREEEIDRQYRMIVKRFQSGFLKIAQVVTGEGKMELPTVKPLAIPKPKPSVVRPPSPQQVEKRDVSDEERLPLGAMKILTTLATRHPIVLTRTQLGTMSGYTASGGTFGNYFGLLKRSGYVGEDGDGVRITEAGLEHVGQVPESPASTAELVEMWKKNLPLGAAKMLDKLVEVYPESMTRDDLGEWTGYTASGGTFGNYFGMLNRNRLIEINGQHVKASEALFQE